jgi:hypothetical protein
LDRALAQNALEQTKVAIDAATRQDEAAAFQARLAFDSAVDFATRVDAAARSTQEIDAESAMRFSDLMMQAAIEDQRLRMDARRMWGEGRQAEADALLAVASDNAKLVADARSLSAQLLADAEARMSQQEYDQWALRWRFAMGEESADRAAARSAEELAAKYGFETLLAEDRAGWDMEEIRRRGEIDVGVANISAASDLATTSMRVSGSIGETYWRAGLGMMELWENSTQSIMANGGTPEAIRMNDAHYMNLIEMASNRQMTFPTLDEDRWR